MLLHILDQDCVGACHLKNYCFVITYLLEDEQELSLGMLIRCKRIYNFLCSMLVLHQLSNVLSMLWYTFYAFSRTNLLTRCHSASSLFSAVFVFQKSYTGNILGIGRDKSQCSYFYRAEATDRRRDGEGQPGGHTYPRRDLGLDRA